MSLLGLRDQGFDGYIPYNGGLLPVSRVCYMLIGDLLVGCVGVQVHYSLGSGSVVVGSPRYLRSGVRWEAVP